MGVGRDLRLEEEVTNEMLNMDEYGTIVESRILPHLFP